MRSLLALVLVSSVAVGQDEDPLPIAPPPRLKTVPAVEKKAEPPTAIEPAKEKVDPTPEPAPKTAPLPEPAPKTVAKAEPPPMTPAPKVEPTPDPKTDAKSDAKDTKTDAKTDEKTETKSTPPPAPGTLGDPVFMNYTLPMYAVYAFGGLAVLVILRTFLLPSKM